MNKQLGLVPHGLDRASFIPIQTFRLELEVEIPDNLGQENSHLGISQILADAVAGAEIKRGEGGFVVIGVLWVQRSVGV